MKVKLICGFRQDQEYSIDIDEAHKAYYAFTRPDVRVIFNSGLALKGSDIQRIVPDWHGTMGWNPTYKLGDDDWNELRNRGIDWKLTKLLSSAKEVSEKLQKPELNTPLQELLEKKYPQLLPSKTKERNTGFKKISESL